MKDNTSEQLAFKLQQETLTRLKEIEHLLGRNARIMCGYFATYEHYEQGSTKRKEIENSINQGVYLEEQLKAELDFLKKRLNWLELGLRQGFISMGMGDNNNVQSK